jgi:hypothetical protein
MKQTTTKADKDKQINLVATEIVNAIGGETARGEKMDIHTLYTFGSLGLLTPLDLSTAFYNSFEKARKKVKAVRKKPNEKYTNTTER